MKFLYWAAGLVAAVSWCGCDSTSSTDDDDDDNSNGGTTSTGGNGGAGGAFVFECGTSSAAALAACVEKQRYVDDLTFIAQPRPPASAHWQAVQDLCADRFQSLGYTVERQNYGSGVNVIGVLQGSSKAAEQVLVAAHYDSTSGSCDGADDNATGVAGTLEVARVLASGSFARTLVVACWDEEEWGYIGSEAYAERALTRGDNITVFFNFEMLGYVSHEPNSQTFPAGFDALFPDAAAKLAANDYRGDFIAIIDDVSAAGPAARVASFADQIGLPYIVVELSAELKVSTLLSGVRRSDHSVFWDRDYPAMMLTDAAEFRNPHYHCSGGPDVVADLDHDFTSKVLIATAGAAAETLEVQ